MQDYRAGTIAALIANTMGSGERVYMPKDFFPALGEAEPEAKAPDASAMLAKAIMVTAALGGEDKRSGHAG